MPVCQDPGTDAFGTTQYATYAHPGIRPLALLKALGNQGVVGSICPAQLNDNSRADYGYRPVLGAMGATVSKSLNLP